MPLQIAALMRYQRCLTMVSHQIYPDFKIKNEKNSGTEIWPRENESDRYNIPQE
jgi:hypothetical protein